MKRSRLYSAAPLCCALLLAITGAACSAPEPASSTPVASAVTRAPAAGAAQADRIRAEIGDAACDSAEQCRTLAYGHKACGGPERYLAYSTKRSDSGRLAELAASYANERRAQDAREGLMSTCSLVTDPGATCSAGRCTLQQQGPGGAVAR